MSQATVTFKNMCVYFLVVKLMNNQLQRLSIENLYSVRKTAFGGTIDSIRNVRGNYDLGHPIVNPIPGHPGKYFVEEGVHRITDKREQGSTEVDVVVTPSLFRIPPIDELTSMAEVTIIPGIHKPHGFGIYY